MRPASDVLSLVIPVYRNEESLSELLIAVDYLYGRLDGAIEAVFVVDGSPDRSWEVLKRQLGTQRFASKLVLLSRNFGSFAAIRVGLEQGTGDRFAVMAADLQEPPELVSEMDALLRAGDVDVVIGVREGRRDPWLTSVPANIFWRLYRRYVVPDMPVGGIDIFACSRMFRDSLLLLEESHSSLIAQVFWLGYRRRTVSYVRRRRTHGKSAWTFSKKLSYLFDSVFAFTDLPIRILIRTGAVGMLTALLLGGAVGIARLLGLIAVPGYAATIFVVVFFAAGNLLSLGIVGSYAWRTYENTKGRPLALMLRTESFEGLETENLHAERTAG